jgi:protein O-mannosyl-transferase
MTKSDLISASIKSKKPQYNKITWPDLLAIAFLVIAGMLVYSNTLDSPFIFDDINFITQNNPNIHITEISFKSLKEAVLKGHPNHRELSKISFALNYYYSGETPRGYHIVNITIHILTGILLFWLIKMTLQMPAARIDIFLANDSNTSEKFLAPILISFFAGLIWLLHPLQTNGVTYMCQRMTSMTALFCVLSLLLFVMGRFALQTAHLKTAALHFAGCLLAGGCAIATKENAVTFPIVIFLFEWYFFQDLRNIRSYRTLPWIVAGFIIFAGVILIYLGESPFHHILSTYTYREFTLPERLLTELRVVAYYFSLIVFPHPSRLILDHAYPISFSITAPPTTIVSLGLMFGLFLVGAYLAKKERLLSFCLLWFLVNLVIESSVIGIEIIYEHRLYLPSMMICLMITLVTFRLLKSAWFSGYVLLAIALFLGIWTYQRNTIWQNEVSFWMDNVQKSPFKARPYQNLAHTFHKMGNYQEAIRYYKKSQKFSPGWTATFYNLGTAYLSIGRYYDAIEYLNQSIQKMPMNAQVHSLLAKALALTGQWDAAEIQYQIALALAPSDNQAQKEYEQLISFLNKYTDPVIRIEHMLNQQPDNAALYVTLGIIYENLNNLPKAYQAYQAAMDLTPLSDNTLQYIVLARIAGLQSKMNKAE